MMNANPVRRPNCVLVRPRAGTMKLAKLARSGRSTKFITLRSVSRQRNAISFGVIDRSSFIEPPRAVAGQSSRVCGGETDGSGRARFRRRRRIEAEDPAKNLPDLALD